MPFNLGNKKRIAVIGSGFAGLSAACYLAKGGYLVDLYEKIRDTTGGAGAAALLGGACGGCNLSINTVELKRVADLADDEVVRCEECRCILVRGV